MLSAVNIMTSILGVVRTMVIETWYTQDIKKPVSVHYIDGNVFSQDNQGNKIGVVMMDGESQASISGTISASVIRADGATVAVSGSFSGSQAWVVLPQSAYAVPGLISIVIKCTDSSVITTLCAVVGTVYQSSTDTTVDPGTIIPSIQTIISEIETAVASIPADYSSLWTSLAPEYDTSISYGLGQYVTYDGAVYKCIVATSPESWTSAHWEATDLGNGIAAQEYETNKLDSIVRLEDEVYLDIPNITPGYFVDYRNGNLIASQEGRGYTDYINVRGFDKLIYKQCKSTGTGGYVGIAFYDYSKTYISGIRWIRSQAAAGYVESETTIPGGAFYARFSTFADTSTYGAFTVRGINLVKEKLDFLDGGLTNVLNMDDGVALPFSIDNPDKLVSYSSGELADSTGGFSATGYIDVKGYKRIKYRRTKTTASSGVSGIAFYDSSKTYISGVRLVRDAAENGYVDYSVDVPATAAFVRCTTYTDTTTYGDFAIYAVNVVAEEINAVKNAMACGSIEAYYLFEPGYIDTTGTTVNISSPVSETDFYHLVIACAPGDVFNPNNMGGNASRVKIVFCDDAGNVLYKGPTGGEYSSSSPSRYNPFLRYVAPAETAYAVFNHHDMDQGFSPVVYKVSPNEDINYAAMKNGEMPYAPIDDWRRLVIATYNQYIAIKDGNNIRISEDCGKTWSGNISASSVGSINNSHFYANGTLAIFDDTHAYYCADKATLNTASVYEANGTTPFVLDETQNFNAQRDYDERKFINGSDMYVFNNYHMVSGSGRPIVWYSIDNGRSYRVAYEFNLDSTYPVRHIHSVMYWPDYDKFIVTTGDENATECHVCALSYNNGSWTCEHLAGSSRDFKWAGTALWNGMLYYTLDNTPGLMARTTYENIPNISQHEILLEWTENDCTNVRFGACGDVVVTQSTARSRAGQTVPTPFTAEEGCRKIYYSTDRKNFAELFIPNQFANKNSLMVRPKPLTTDGHLYYSTSQGTDGLPSVCVDDYARIFVNKQAFRPKL